MKRSAGPIIASMLLAIVAITAPSTARAQSTPAASKAGASHPASSVTSARGQRPRYTTADVHFMQGMIAHHAQAMAMTSLVGERTSSDDVQLVAQRIRVSQRDEIALMRNWLREHGEEVPSPDTMVHMHDAGNDSAMRDMPGMAGMAGMASRALMPGMLTHSQMMQLAASSGPEFDRLFLKFMIQHHEGALTMVRALFGSRGAGQVPEIYRFASDIDSDQRMEIERMRALLHELQPADSSRHSLESVRHSLESAPGILSNPPVIPAIHSHLLSDVRSPHSTLQPNTP